jgi:hypothetical protein
MLSLLIKTLKHVLSKYHPPLVLKKIILLKFWKGVFKTIEKVNVFTLDPLVHKYFIIK